jgi:protein-S-isoprenylcysteine O-methyltransferase Ste14
MRFIEFHILASLCFISFIISILETSNKIKDFYIISDIRLRNLIDLSMILFRFLLPMVSQLEIPVPPTVSIAVGLPIFFSGIILIILSLRRIYRFLMLKEEKKLVKDGVYGLVRHPLYLGDSIWPVGWSLIWTKLCSLILTPIWLLFYIVTTFYEEKRLEEEFGDEYREYRKRVRRIIPLVY